MESKFILAISIIVLCATAELVQTSNILFLLPIATKSHKNVFDPLILALAEKGHNVTVIAPLKFKTPVKNVREIVPLSFEEINRSVTAGNPFQNRANQGRLGFFMNWNSTIVEVGCDRFYRNPEVKEILKNEKDTFDVILVNAFMNQCVLGMIHELGAPPHIYVVTMPAINFIVQKAGLYLPPSFVPCSFLPYTDRMSFKERSVNFLFEHLLSAVGKLYYNDYFSKMYQKHLGYHLPKIDAIDANVSLIMMNSHFTLTYPRPLLPDVIEVGGMHTRPPKELPKDIEEFVSGSKDGVILFSLGSIVQGKDMPPETSAKFVNVFSRLKQRVLWKWEGDTPANISSNVMLSKWLPQQDILGHPNLKIFMTHGGLLSIQEAVYHGVPLIGFPFFVDQDLNLLQAEKAGFAVKLEINEFTEEMLESAIHRILTDKSLSEKAAKVSSTFKDQPNSPIERATYWVEYIIRHKGAHHLRSVGRELTFAAYHSIDVISVILCVIFVTLWLIKKLVTIVFRLICGMQKSEKWSGKSENLLRKKQQ